MNISSTQPAVAANMITPVCGILLLDHSTSHAYRWIAIIIVENSKGVQKCGAYK